VREDGEGAVSVVGKKASKAPPVAPQEGTENKPPRDINQRFSLNKNVPQNSRAYREYSAAEWS
jgi:hypothetical protein